MQTSLSFDWMATRQGADHPMLEHSIRGSDSRRELPQTQGGPPFNHHMTATPDTENMPSINLSGTPQRYAQPSSAYCYQFEWYWVLMTLVFLFTFVTVGYVIWVSTMLVELVYYLTVASLPAAFGIMVVSTTL